MGNIFGSSSVARQSTELPSIRSNYGVTEELQEIVQTTVTESSSTVGVEIDDLYSSLETDSQKSSEVADGKKPSSGSNKQREPSEVAVDGEKPSSGSDQQQEPYEMAANGDKPLTIPDGVVESSRTTDHRGDGDGEKTQSGTEDRHKQTTGPTISLTGTGLGLQETATESVTNRNNHGKRVDWRKSGANKPWRPVGGTRRSGVFGSPPLDAVWMKRRPAGYVPSTNAIRSVQKKPQPAAPVGNEGSATARNRPTGVGPGTGNTKARGMRAMPKWR